MMAVAMTTVATWSLRIDRDPLCCAAQVTGRLGAVTYFLHCNTKYVRSVLPC